MSESTPLPLGYEQACPHCGHTMDADTHAHGDARPAPGDVSVCLYCTGFLVFNHDMTRRAMTDEDQAELDPETKSALMHLRRTIQETRP